MFDTAFKNNLAQQLNSLSGSNWHPILDRTSAPLSFDSIPKFSSHSSAPVLEQAVHKVELALSRFAADPNRETTMDIAFGNNWNREAANSLFQGWAVYNFDNLPRIEIRLGSEINNANAAFSSDNQTIYLSHDFLTQYAGNVEQVAGVLLEEIGHAIDFRINQYDAAGDEGDIFSRLVRGEQISAGDLFALKTENDHALITLDGSSVAIEMSQIQMAEVGGKLYQTHRGTDNGIYIASSNNGKDWSGWEKLPGATENAPAIVNLRGTAYIAHRGLDNRIYFASYDNAKAGRWQALPNGGVTPDALAMVEHRGKIYMAHRGQDNGIYLASSSDGVNWNRWSKLAGETPDAIAMAVSQGKLYLAHRGMGNQIFTAWLEGDSDRFSGWKQQAGTTPDSLSLTDFNGKLYAMHRGINNHMYISSLSNGQNWDSWKELPGETPSAPFIRAFQDKLYATHQGKSDQIFLGAINSNGSFIGWQERGGSTPIDGNRLTQLAQKPGILSSEEIREYRQLVGQKPEAERTEWYRQLQPKIQFFNQLNNESSYYDRFGLVNKWNMCGVTSLSGALTYLGVKNPKPGMQFEDALEVIRREQKFTPKDGGAESWKALGELSGYFGVTSRQVDGGLTDSRINDIKAALDRGASVILGIRKDYMGHLVRIQGYDSTGFIIDDPFGDATQGFVNGIDKGEPYTTYKVRNTSNNDSETQFGNNSKWSWNFTKGLAVRYLVLEQGSALQK
jgi:Peptidase_C39 like family